MRLLGWHCKLLFLPLFAIFFCRTTSQNQQAKDMPTDCGTKRGCWLVPPGCGPGNCSGEVSWTVDGQTISWTMRVLLDDLRNSMRSDTTYYAALGFSLDEFMGDDTVIVCTVDNTGYGGVFLAWNDHNANYLQLQATEALLSGTSASQVDGRLSCQGSWSFGGYAKLHDLSKPGANFHLLLARGFADPRIHQLYGHSAADGPKFPWVSSDSVTFCADSDCGSQPSNLPWLNASHQSVPSRTAKCGWAMIHGLLMSLAIFVLLPLGIFSARFGRSFQRQIGGQAIWFQIHRACMLSTFVIMSIAFFGVFWQQNFRFFTCSALCLTDDFNKFLHAIIGTVVYSLCCLQVLIGLFFRPALNSPRRHLFNFVHRFIGFCILLGAGANAALSTSIGKTGFLTMYGKKPHLVMAVSCISLLFCFAICEWLSRGQSSSEPPPPSLNLHRVQRLKDAPAPIAAGGVGEPVGEQKEQQATAAGLRSSFWLLLMLAFNSLAGLAALGILGAMLIRAFQLIAGFT